MGKTPSRDATSRRRADAPANQTDTEWPSRSTRLQRPSWGNPRVGKRIRAANRVAGDNIRAGNLRGRKKPIHVSRKLMCVLKTRRRSTPTLAGAIEDTDARLGRDVALYPSPVRCSLGEPVEQDHGGRPRTGATQIETVTSDKIGATATRAIAARTAALSLTSSPEEWKTTVLERIGRRRQGSSVSAGSPRRRAGRERRGFETTVTRARKAVPTENTVNTIQAVITGHRNRVVWNPPDALADLDGQQQCLRGAPAGVPAFSNDHVDSSRTGFVGTGRWHSARFLESHSPAVGVSGIEPGAACSDRETPQHREDPRPGQRLKPP